MVIYYGEIDYNHFNNKNGEHIENKDIYEMYHNAMQNSLSDACCENLMQSFHERTAKRHMDGKVIEMPT